jgi:hypothetical protein
MHSTSTVFFFSPTKNKRIIRTETEETFTVGCSYSSTSLPVKKLDKDLSKKKKNDTPTSKRN